MGFNLDGVQYFVATVLVITMVVGWMLIEGLTWLVGNVSFG